MTSGQLAQDPDERFDVVTVDGEPTGIVKRRADVHRDGDWHRAVHIWLIGEDDGAPWILFQRRGLQKDTWPGELDCTVGGHLAAGESLVDAYREVQEEIGILIDPGSLRPIGVRRAINDRPGLHLDRELQDVFLIREERPLVDIHPNPVELESVVKVPLDPLLDLLAGDRDSIDALERPAIEEVVRPVRLRASDVIRTTDNYFYRVAIAARNALRGDRHIAV